MDKRYGKNNQMVNVDFEKIIGNQLGKHKQTKRKIFT